MEHIDYSGYWVGTFSGTNQGGLTITLQQDGNMISGTAKVSEPSLGQYECRVSGTVSDKISLLLTPTQIHGNFFVKPIKIDGAVKDRNSISGRWISPAMRTEGIFTVQRENTVTLGDTLPQEDFVFVVHGHDNGTKNAVARFLEQMHITPVILHEQINQGMTIIEKFETYANKARFAVILMTPDDYGYPKGNEGEKKFRPRQNVLLELGYFFAKLGRTKTLVLTSGELDLPSDIFGIVYTPINNDEGWKVTLAKVY